MPTVLIMLQLKRIKTFVAALALFICAPTFAQTTTQPYQPPAEKSPYENLLSKSELAREDARVRILRANSILDLTLTSHFETLMKERPSDMDAYEKPFHLTIRLLGELRVAKAQSRLLDIADYQIDPQSIPPVACIFDNVYTYYPAAFSISQIGDKALMYDIWSKMHSPASEIRLRLYTYLMKKELGTSIALLLVEQRLKKANDWLKLANQTTSDEKTNLETIKSLLESKQFSIKAPKTRLITLQPKAP